MIILLIASVLLWGRRIGEDLWLIALMIGLVELLVELLIIVSYLGVA
jgi:hypothetical protein